VFVCLHFVSFQLSMFQVASPSGSSAEDLLGTLMPSACTLASSPDEAWNPVLVASDFTRTVPEDAEMNEEEWAEYVSYNIGKVCPAPKPGDEERIRAKGWPSWRAYQALKRVANW